MHPVSLKTLMQAELHLGQVTKGGVKSASIAELFGKFCKAKNGFFDVCLLPQRFKSGDTIHVGGFLHCCDKNHRIMDPTMSRDPAASFKPIYCWLQERLQPHLSMQ